MNEQPTACPACSANAFIADARGGGACTNCGYAAGEANRCPHCKATARIDGNGMHAVCAVCGGPRIPGGYGGETAAAALKEQRKAIGNGQLSSVATVVQAIAAAIATSIALAIMPSSILGKVIAFVFAATPLFLALRSRSRATAARANAKNAADRAWQAAAEDVAMRSKKGITADALAKTLAVTPVEADRLLTALTVHDRARIDVGDDAEVVYSVQPDAMVRVGEDARVRVSDDEDLLAQDDVDAGAAAEQKGSSR